MALDQIVDNSKRGCEEVETFYLYPFFYFHCKFFIGYSIKNEAWISIQSLFFLNTSCPNPFRAYSLGIVHKAKVPANDELYLINFKKREMDCPMQNDPERMTGSFSEKTKLAEGFIDDVDNSKSPCAELNP